MTPRFPSIAEKSPRVVAVVGLETSHALAWVTRLKSIGCEVVATDDGSVISKSTAEGFCRTHGIRWLEDPREVAGRVDAAAILSCNWDRHRSQAEPFVEAGKAIYVDKPVAGSEDDLSYFENLQGRAVFGSANRYYPGLAAMAGSEAPAEITVRTSQRGDFYYAVHAIEIVLTLAAGPLRVRARVEAQPFPVLELDFDHGTTAQISWSQTQPGFVVERRTGDISATCRFKAGGILTNRLVEDLWRVHADPRPMLIGKTGIAAARVWKNFRQSAEKGGAWEPALQPIAGPDGAAFAAHYAGEMRSDLQSISRIGPHSGTLFTSPNREV